MHVLNRMVTWQFSFMPRLSCMQKDSLVFWQYFLSHEAKSQLKNLKNICMTSAISWTNRPKRHHRLFKLLQTMLCSSLQPCTKWSKAKVIRAISPAQCHNKYRSKHWIFFLPFWEGLEMRPARHRQIGVLHRPCIDNKTGPVLVICWAILYRAAARDVA